MASVVVALAGITSSDLWAQDAIELAPGSKLTYSPPIAVPTKRGPTFRVDDGVAAFDRLVDVLEESPLQIDSSDRDRGVIVAQYESDPELFLDCGLYTRVFPVGINNFRVQPIPAARERILLADAARDEQVERRVALFGRTTFEFDYDDAGADISFSTLYAVTLKFQLIGKDAEPGDEEVISFRNDGQAQFETGTACQSSGRLENLIAAIIDETLKTLE